MCSNPNTFTITLKQSAYILTTDGTSFEQEANPEIKPFQSFVLTDAKTLSTLRSLRIGDGVVTGNQTIEPVDGYYMRSLGGMEQFVANGWARKDYTHINYAGGRRVAWSLVDAINAGAYEAHAAAEAARIRRQAEQAVLDSVRLLKIDRELRPVSAIGNLNTPRK